jgi:hypothetical protein
MRELFSKSLSGISLLTGLLTLLFTSFSVQAQTLIDVWDSSDPNDYQLVGTIETIRSAQTGAGHYNY